MLYTPSFSNAASFRQLQKMCIRDRAQERDEAETL